MDPPSRGRLEEISHRREKQVRGSDEQSLASRRLLGSYPGIRQLVDGYRMGGLEHVLNWAGIATGITFGGIASRRLE